MNIFTMILSLLSGVAMFLYGMLLMGDGLKMVAGNKLEKFLYKMTNTPLKGVALGGGSDLCDSVLLRHNSHGDWLCKFHDDEAAAGNQYYHGGKHRNQYYRLDLMPFLY